MPVSARFTFPGEPITKLPAGITVRSVISVPAATMLPAPIVTPFKMTAPMPIKQRDSMVQPCSVTEWPMVTSSPRMSGHSPRMTWQIEPS